MLNVPVLFHDPAGVLLARVSTDATGEAFGDVPDGSTVTVVPRLPVFGQAVLISVTDVARGDILVFGSPSSFMFDGTLTLELPVAPDASPFYIAASDCGFTSGSSTTLLVFGRTLCPAPTSNVMALVRSGQDIVRYHEVVEVPLIGSPTVTVPAWSAAVPHTVSITGAPAERHVRATLSYIRGGRVFYESVVPILDGTYSDAVGGEAWKVSTTVTTPGFPLPFQTLETMVADPTAINITVGGMPSVTSSGFDAGARVVSWTTNGDGYLAAYAEAVLLDEGNQPTAVWATLVSGAAPKFVRLPQLPADLTHLWDFADRDDDAARVTLINTRDPSYAAFRQRAFRGFPADEPVQRSVSRSVF